MINRIGRLLRSHWEPKLLVGFLLVVVAIYFSLAFILSRGAAHIFNQTATNQHMLRGQIQVEAISANVFGKVSFKNLVWTDQDGDQILLVPEGYMKICVLDLMTDVIKGHVGASVVGEIHLEGAQINADFDDDNLGVDIVAKDKLQAKPKSTDEKGKALERRLRNLDWKGEFINATLYLDKCLVNVHKSDRNYSLNDVNGEVRINTHHFIKLDLTSGKFQGDAIGDGVRIKGDIDLSKMPKDIPSLDLQVDALAVDPGSLGFGSVHDTMTLLTHWTGPLSRPQANGELTMPILRIPALTFTNLTGRVHYENGIMAFDQVEADVFGGRLKAQGIYNIDSRAYTILGQAQGLISSEALHTPDFDVFVDANIHMESEGQKRPVHVYGDFKSSPGRYFIIPIEEITGVFDNVDKTLSFFDVLIKTSRTTITTDALTIDHGNLKLGPINVLLANGSDLFLSQEVLSDDSAQVVRARQSLAGVGPNIKDIKRDLEAMKAGKEELSDFMGQAKLLRSSLTSLKGTIDHLNKMKAGWNNENP